jgi:hypothetical protein
MITTSRLWTLFAQIDAAEGNGPPFDGRIAALGARIPKGRRASLLSAVAFRLWAAASICLATDGATATESTAMLSPICAAADLRLMMLIEAHGEAQDVSAETLSQAFLTVLEARKACNGGQAEAGIKLYESIPLGPGMSRRQ